VHNFSIILKFLNIVVFDAHKVRSGKNKAFPGFIESYQPEIYELLLFFLLVHLLETLDKCLKSADHVSKESDSNHLDQHLVQVFILSGADTIPITDTGESGYDPIETCNVDRRVVINLYFFVDEHHNPPAVVVIHLIHSKQDPDVRQEV